MAEKKSSGSKATRKPAAKKAAKPVQNKVQKTAPQKVAPSQAVRSVPDRLHLPRLPWTLPLRTFARWALVIIVAFVLVSTWLAHTLVSARQEDLLAEIKQRSAIQASGRVSVLQEWLAGQMNIANNLTNSDLMRLFSTEMTLNRLASGDQGDPNKNMRSALVAQVPYMQQTVKDLVHRHGLLSAYVLDQSSQPFLGSDDKTTFSSEQKRGISAVFASGEPLVLGVRMFNNTLALDILKPILALDDETQHPPVSAVLLMSVPVSQKIPSLLDLGPLGQQGERAVLLQRNGMEDLVMVRQGSLSTLESTESELIGQTATVLTPISSPIDGKSVFATLLPVEKTPFRILHEYNAAEALSFMELYANGVYGMVTLACLLFIVSTFLIVAHLLAQRNRHRVRHQGKTMEALVRAVEIRDPYLSGHHNRMARLAVTLANDLGLPVRQRSTLFYAAQLSGIGKIFVPQSVLTKKGKLSKDERKEVETHIHHAMLVLKDIEFDLPVAEVIEQMYERMDGSGYPAQMKGQEINILSRILAVCDTYCAMTRPRAYRDALNEAEALQYLKEHLELFDKRVVDVLSLHVAA